MTITTEEAEQLATVHDWTAEDEQTSMGLRAGAKMTAAALRSLAAERDALRAENARLREVLRAFPGFVDDATIGDMWIERKNAALGGEGNE
jgi:hypothetical protein